MFEKLRVPLGKTLDLSDYDPAEKPLAGESKDDDKARMADLAVKLDELQTLLHANNRHRVLLVLQGMDTSGKDGTIRAVFQNVDPLGVRVANFKAPTPIELSRDFLWRVHMAVPAAGELAIFNRSHYEDVLITRVHDWIDAQECKRRYAHINNFERLLADSHTTIVKCFLHISPEEQRKRLQERIDDPNKHWKFELGDLKERSFWPQYMKAYEAALSATSTEYAPWYIVPSDSKRHRNLMVAELLVAAMSGLKLSYPPARPELTGMKVE
ncbi:polyphosphate kinase 2 family protein [Pandoraea nosoerga]|uniref:Polyphosphate kinase n=1 Tax=Pandoraea nosoerga TaxID=2508296 RepID=A0A5E4Y5I8_9BURK|nr:MULTISPECIES: polyphosphate kinase 2 family protein [Pandoraea]MBN4667414.1 polyphosphate kinase 2 family protein [Pandoraea nosoerga]MBN4677389.1 polyphosphate kinase 2 family protein [Pandoraea nosoerga]MBN4682222.1 polyphosphate kinase 2 family protein [Pandoraea nosoerga]MBN4746509.1 polyphosphate kinase 2 family protein [Pandoraea nosoerga]VVE43638.1 polyphosphate kinase [Pandoraea nosoerga]